MCLVNLCMFFFYIGFSVALIPSGSYGDFQLLLVETPNVRISEYPYVLVKPQHRRSAGRPPHVNVFVPTETRSRAQPSVSCWQNPSCPWHVDAFSYVYAYKFTCSENARNTIDSELPDQSAHLHIPIRSCIMKNTHCIICYSIEHERTNDQSVHMRLLIWSYTDSRQSYILLLRIILVIIVLVWNMRTCA